MKRPIFFCKSWFRGKKQLTELQTEEQAKEAHETKRFYTVLVDSEDFPYCFLEITEKSVGVSFLDDYLREFLMYDFQEFESGKMFMTAATYREYVEDTDKIKKGTTYIFQRDGTVRIDSQVFVPNTGVLDTAYTIADVSHNYEEYPKFGEYDNFIQIERNPEFRILDSTTKCDTLKI